MELNSFVINPGYSSLDDSDPYHDFFLPCFANSNYYARYGGFFTSKNLVICAEGIEEFIKNYGRMQLVLTPTFSQEDLEAIKQGLITKEKKITDDWISKFDSIKDGFEKDHVRALSWMIAQDPPLLEIKLAIFNDSQGNPLGVDEIRQKGLAEISVGVFHDPRGNGVSFSGIIKKGLDDEESIDITVHKSWLQKEHVDREYEKFRAYWEEADDLLEGENEPVNVSVIGLPKEIKDKLVELKPNSLDELDLRKKRVLRPYQKEARDSWFIHGGRGIYEMATGTGKTFTAISCIDELVKNNEKLLVVIACPTNVLVNQWTRELKYSDYQSINTTKGHVDWQPKLKKIRNGFKNRTNSNPQIIVSSYATYHSDDFKELIEQIDASIVLIADEVHEAGSPLNQTGLLEKYHYRLGLSATPDRYFDEEGTNVLHQYFKPQIDCGECHGKGAVIIRKDLKWAIENEVLVPYYYYPYYVDLSEDELDRYREITRKIAPELSKKKEKQNKELLQIFFSKRANVIKNAVKKIDALQKILQKNNNKLEYCLIYCAPGQSKDDEQIKKVQDVLNKIPIPNSIIKSGITSDAEKEKILTQIASGVLNVGLAINILDQGIDIPPLKTAILLSSTGNKKQFIQRRGRILRKWNGGIYRDGSKKEHAVIYDIFVVPYMNKKIIEFAELEKTIVEKELRRHQEMAEISLNPDFSMGEINKIKEVYGCD